MFLQRSFICVRISPFLLRIFSVFYNFRAPEYLRILIKIFPGHMLLHCISVIFTIFKLQGDQKGHQHLAGRDAECVEGPCQC